MRAPDSALAGRGGRPHVGRAVLIGLAVTYVGLLLLAPVAGILWVVIDSGAQKIVDTLGSSDVHQAFWLTFVITIITIAVTTVFGVSAAWVLTRDNLPGRSLIGAIVDLPLATS